MEGRRGHFRFYTFTRTFVYRWHLTMQGMRTCPNLSNNKGIYIQFIVITMVLCINLIHGRLSMHSTHVHDGGVFLKHTIYCGFESYCEQYTDVYPYIQHMFMMVEFSWSIQFIVGSNPIVKKNFSFCNYRLLCVPRSSTTSIQMKSIVTNTVNC